MSAFLFKKFYEVTTINKYAVLPKPVKKESNLVNESIKFPKVMVIDEEGKQLGVIDTPKAISIAYDHNLDLVCVAPQAQPPVCKILNYSKFRYEKEKKEKEAKKNQKNQAQEEKEIQLSPTIAEHDTETKLKQALKFLAQGNKVKVTLRIKRRYLSLADNSVELVNDFVAKCSEVGETNNKKPDFDGKLISIVISPKKQTSKKKAPKQEVQSEEVKEDNNN